MKSLKEVFAVKKILPLFVLVAALSFYSGCDTIINSVVEELPENPDEGASNPNDPDSDAFLLPGLELSNNNYSFDSPFLLTSNSLELSWDVVDSSGFNINFDYSFSFRLASPSENLSSQPFEDLGSDRSVFISDLNETFNDEVYTFEVRATYEGGSSPKDTSFTGSFYVDAFQQRGFLFNPTRITVNDDGTYTATIFLDEIQESDDLTAFSLVVDFNGNQITPLQERIRVLDDSGSFLNRSGVDEVIWFSEAEFSSVTIDVGLAGNNIDPLSGGGAVCEIVFEPTPSFNGTNIEISTNSVLKTSEGQNIQIGDFDSARLIQ